jgi:hypothetical protein
MSIYLVNENAFLKTFLRNPDLHGLNQTIKESRIEAKIIDIDKMEKQDKETKDGKRNYLNNLIPKQMKQKPNKEIMKINLRNCFFLPICMSVVSLKQANSSTFLYICVPVEVPISNEDLETK